MFESTNLLEEKSLVAECRPHPTLWITLGNATHETLVRLFVLAVLGERYAFWRMDDVGRVHLSAHIAVDRRTLRVERGVEEDRVATVRILAPVAHQAEVTRSYNLLSVNRVRRIRL